MSRPGNSLGYRLGYSKNWKIFNNNFLKKEKFDSISIFIFNWIKNTLVKKKFWILDINIKKIGTVYNVNILSHINMKKNSQATIIQHFWTVYSHTNIYTYPVIMKFFKVKNNPISPYWDSPKMGYFFKKWVKRKYLKKKYEWKKRFYMLTMSLLMENDFRLRFNKDNVLKNISIKINLYDIFEYFPQHCNNILSNNLVRFFETFLSDQRKIKTDLKKYIFYIFLGIILRNSSLIANSIASVLSKGKEHGPMLYFFFKIIKEIFEVVPKIDRRVNFIKIIIKGKIAGNERAVKQIFSLGNLDKYNAVHKDIPLHTKNNEVDYAFTEAYTYTGVLSIRVWTC